MRPGSCPAGLHEAHHEWLSHEVLVATASRLRRSCRDALGQGMASTRWCNSLNLQTTMEGSNEQLKAVSEVRQIHSL